MKQSTGWYHTASEPVNMRRAVDEYSWLGEVVKLHEIGPYHIVEYWQQPAVNSEDKTIYRAFGGYINGHKTSHSFGSLDECLVGLITMKHEGPNSQAGRYFIRGLVGGDMPREKKPK